MHISITFEVTGQLSGSPAVSEEQNLATLRGRLDECYRGTRKPVDCIGGSEPDVVALDGPTQELDTGLRSGLLTTALSTAASRDSGVAELADYINNGYIYAILMVISLLNLDRF